jgi:RNA polymerase subunit RPABC4/transcription elongation factor Spt4
MIIAVTEPKACDACKRNITHSKLCSFCAENRIAELEQDADILSVGNARMARRIKELETLLAENTERLEYWKNLAIHWRIKE